MVSKDEQRDRVVGLLSSNLLKTGLSRTSLRQLAAAAGTSDRMLLYYFKDKTEILTAVLSRIAAEVSEELAIAIPDHVAHTPTEFIAKAVEVTRSERLRPYMRLWVEAVALASRGEQPYLFISSQILQGFTDWIETRLVGKAGQAKRASAVLIMAMIDGLALLDICALEDHVHMAVQAMHRISFPSHE